MVIAPVLKANAGWLLLGAIVAGRYLYPSFFHSGYFIAALLAYLVITALLVLIGKVHYTFNTHRNSTDPEGIRNLFFGLDLFVCAMALIGASYIWWIGGGYVFLIGCGVAALMGISMVIDYRRGPKWGT